MVTSIGQKAIYGMQAGGVIAVAPVAFTVMLAGKNALRHIISGLWLRFLTEGQYDSAINVALMSPRLWRITTATATVGSAISAISLIGFVFVEKRLPTSRDFSQQQG